MPSVAELAKLFEAGISSSSRLRATPEWKKDFEKLAPPMRADWTQHSQAATRVLTGTLSKTPARLAERQKVDPTSPVVSYSMSGVSLDFLRHLIAQNPHMSAWNSEQLCRELVKPVVLGTYEHMFPTSVADPEPRSWSDDAVHLATDMFSSFSWSSSIADVLHQVQGHVAFVWIDVCAVPGPPLIIVKGEFKVLLSS
jgi:hypothetical protein